MNKDIKEIKTEEKIVFNEFKELEKKYIYESHNIAEEYYMSKGKNVWSDVDALVELENFIKVETAIHDRISELRELQKNKENE